MAALESLAAQTTALPEKSLPLRSEGAGASQSIDSLASAHAESRDAKPSETSEKQSSGDKLSSPASDMSPESDRSYSPGTREIANFVVQAWKADKATESLSYAKLLALVKNGNLTWALSEKRLRASLKEFNLQPNQQVFTYVKQTKSSATPRVSLPGNIKLTITKSRGKGLFATKPMAEGDSLWDESPLVQAAPVEFVRLMRSGNACAYCAKTLRTSEGQLLSSDAGTRCADCPANWCNVECKRADYIHMDTWHDVFRNRFNVTAWTQYEQHCMNNNWKAGYLYGITLMYKIKNDPRLPGIARNIESMARISQEIRQQAVSSPGTLEFEELERMWKRGHAILAHAVKGVYKLTYEEFIEGIGLVNLNNVDGCIFLIHCHLNHNCTPNVTVKVQPTRPQGIKVFSKLGIKPGQELTTSYVDPSLPVEERRYKLRVNWGFICSCDRCRKELAELQQSPPAPNKETVTRKRGKSVHFDKNPVSQTVQIPT